MSSLFQKSVLNKYLRGLDKELINTKYEAYKQYFLNPEIQENIKGGNEVQFQATFLNELFVKILGYTLFPSPNYNLKTEYKNIKNAGTADGAILQDGKAIGVIELKGTNTSNLDKIEEQAFGYKHNQPSAIYVIACNFERLRFYIDNAVKYEEFNLFHLSLERFKVLYLCLAKKNIFTNRPKQIKDASLEEEQAISTKFYKSYSDFKNQLFQNITKLNPEYNQLQLYKKTQKLLDRFIFIFFAEDRGLLPPNSIRTIIEQWVQLRDELDAYTPLYNRFKMYFGYMNTGYKGKKHDIFAYNGGLFAPDEVLDNIKIDDTILYTSTQELSAYDFDVDVDVNILGKIFEHSLNEIEEVTAQLEGKPLDKSKTKRKKDGVFYTPKYITKYIVENTIGKLCEEKKNELKINESEYDKGRKGRNKATVERLKQQLDEYRDWLLKITICDPACGSGAFLNQALEFLIEEHTYVDELETKLLGGSFVFPNVENAILENNLYGVDINEESVEIAKLSLWLRTAKPNRKLNSLNSNIKCGNSLIDDPNIAGDKAFNWEKEFPKVFENGGFDVVIGNPPYGVNFDNKTKEYLTDFDKLVPDFEVYIYFISLYKKILGKNRYLSYIFPNTFLSTLFGIKYREWLFNAVSVYQIIDLSNDNTFTDASVRTIIFSFENNKDVYECDFNKIKHKEIRQFESYQKSELIDNIENLFSLFAQNKDEKNIIVKVKNNKSLRNYHEVSQGYIPYRRSDLIKKYGKEEGNKIVDNRLWHSKYNIDGSWKKEILGKNVRRYNYHLTGGYIKYSKEVASYVLPKFFEKNRLLIREITSTQLYTSYIKEVAYNNPSLINIIDEKNVLNLKYTLTLLNSTLIGWYHNKTSPKANKGLFPKILINDVRNIPIVKISEEAQKPFIQKANEMLLLNDKQQGKINRFLKRLTDNLNIEKPSKKLQSFYDYDSKTFVKELKKKKVKLSLTEQDEWEDYFNAYTNEIKVLQTEINRIDKEIDMMVYELYGLTEEEISIVENS